MESKLFGIHVKMSKTLKMGKRRAGIVRQRSKSSSETMETSSPVTINIEATRSEECLCDSSSSTNSSRQTSWSNLSSRTNSSLDCVSIPELGGTADCTGHLSVPREKDGVTGTGKFLDRPRSSSCSNLGRPNKKGKNLLAVVLNKTLHRSKSKSADQNVGAGYDADVIGGSSRLAGPSGGESEHHAGTGRPHTERRYSWSLSSRLAEDTVTYTVQDNDTLNSVAARFDTTPSELVSLNKLNSRLIFPGQLLHVPRKEEEGSTGPAEDATTASAAAPSGSDASKETAASVPALATTPPTKNDEHAFLENLRPPGSPRPARPGESSGQQPSEPDWSLISSGEDLNLEAERIKDRQLYDKFLRLDVRHITDGQGIVSGVLLVTPNTMMFDPNVSDPLVIEHGPEVYGMITQLDCVANAAMFADIALIKNNDDPDAQLDSVYFPTSCPLHKKYQLLKRKMEERQAERKQREEGEQQEEAKEELKEEVDKVQGSSAEGDDEEDGRSRADSFGEVLADRRSIPLEVRNPATDTAEEETAGQTSVTLDLGRIGETVTDLSSENTGQVTAEGAGAAGQETEAQEDSEKTRSESCVSPEDLVETRPSNPFASPLISVCKRTPSEEAADDDGDDQLKAGDADPESEERQKSKTLSDKLEAVSQKLDFGADQLEGSGRVAETRRLFESTARDTPSELEFRPRHFSAGATGLPTPPRRGRFFRLAKGGAPESGSSESNFSSSPESRGHKMLKRLSYPLTWMGESFSSDSTSKDNSAPNSAGYEENQPESVFAKVFSSSHRNFVDLNSGLFARSPDQWPRVRDLKDQEPPRSSYLAPSASEYGDSSRRSSGEASSTSKASKAPPSKMNYRSMVSVDDVPELFASIDKLIPKPAKSCDDPPLYLRLRMAKPKRKAAATSHVMSYGMHRKKAVYWFSVPRDKADDLCRFFLLWAPEVYGAYSTAQLESRGLDLLKTDTDWDADDSSSSGFRDSHGHKDHDSGSGFGAAADYLARESWERAKAPYVRLFTMLRNQDTLYESEQDENEFRRALSQAESDIYVPDRVGQSEILTDDQIRQLALRLPARVAGCTWTLTFTTSHHGFSLNSLYRKMAELDNPVLLLIKDTQENIFGAYSPVELRVSEHFYGTGEAFLFTFSPEFRVFHWSGENSYYVKGNNESLVFGAGDGRFGLWLDGDLYQGRSQNCKTFHNDPLNPDEDFLIRTVECWTFV